MPKKEDEEEIIKDPNELIQAGVQEGYEELTKRHPIFRDTKFIEDSLDKRRLRKNIKIISKKLEEEGRGMSYEEKMEYLQENIADSIANGYALNEHGKRVLVKKGLEERVDESWFSKTKRKGRLDEEDELDNMLDAFEELYPLAKEGQLDQIPEALKAVAKGKGISSAYTVLNILRSRNLISSGDYKGYKYDIRDAAEELLERTKKGASSAIEYKQAAALILGIAGIVIVLSSGIGITGGVIGSILNHTFSNIIGVILFIIAQVIFLKNL